MSERIGRDLSGDYFDSSVHGTTEADDRHVSAEEAQAALNADERPEELPERDERFDPDPSEDSPQQS
jgi:hypothetical protein